MLLLLAMLLRKETACLLIDNLLIKKRKDTPNTQNYSIEMCCGVFSSSLQLAWSGEVGNATAEDRRTQAGVEGEDSKVKLPPKN